MLRVVSVLALLVGCDQAFGLERPIPESACGRYDALREVEFDGSALEDVTDLSVDVSGQRGFVQATHGSRTGVTPVRLDGDTWTHDPTFEANLAQLQTQEFVLYGRISYGGDLFASQRSQSTGDYSVYHYKFMSAKWTLANNFAISLASEQSTYAGSELDTVETFGTFSRVPILHVPNSGAPYVAIADRGPGVAAWTESVSGGRLTTYAINEVHDVTHAVLANGPNGKLVMVYAARLKGETTGSDLYLSEKDGAYYPVGIPLGAVNTDDEEVEPWVSEDCRTLYFRRGDTIMTAEAR